MIFIIPSASRSMSRVSFPDGSERVFEDGISVKEVAEGISHSLMKKSVVAVVNDKVVDLATKLTANCTLKIITSDTKDTKDKQILLDTMRHSCAHLFAQAMRELYGDKVHFGFGPEVENGFYYDFELTDGTKITTEDFPKIEKKMHELAERDFEVVRIETTKEAAMEFFDKQGEKYKVELLKEKLDSVFVKIMEDLLGKNKFTLFTMHSILEDKGIKDTENFLNKNCDKLIQKNPNLYKEIKKYEESLNKENNDKINKITWRLVFEYLYYLLDTTNRDNKELEKLGMPRFFINWGPVLHEACKKNIKKLLQDQRITTYTQGNFTDLCKGPHIVSTGIISCWPAASTESLTPCGSRLSIEG